MNLLSSRVPFFNFAPGRFFDSGGTLGQSALVDPIFYKLDGCGRQWLAPQGHAQAHALGAFQFQGDQAGGAGGCNDARKTAGVELGRNADELVLGFARE